MLRTLSLDEIAHVSGGLLDDGSSIDDGSGDGDGGGDSGGGDSGGGDYGGGDYGGGDYGGGDYGGGDYGGGAGSDDYAGGDSYGEMSFSDSDDANSDFTLKAETCPKGDTCTVIDGTNDMYVRDQNDGQIYFSPQGEAHYNSGGANVDWQGVVKDLGLIATGAAGGAGESVLAVVGIMGAAGFGSAFIGHGH